MNKIRANRLIEEILGKLVGGWEVMQPLGAGKSAVVFRAVRGGVEAALKVFDPEFIDQAGREIQLKRITRELSLKEVSHPHLVRILDGGECAQTNHLFIVMERVDAPNLAEVLKDVPREAIRPMISQIAEAARFLESLDPPLAHRDIKPDNIAVSRDFGKATLLDLGVILPINLKDQEPSSDEERRFFVGTLRYGPPEFLVRTEEYTVDGWRAITFYQLGAVLYDMIMKERIFEELADPYPRLVMAVEHEIPRITAKDIPEELILLANNCLSKDPQIRLRYVSWDDFAAKTPGLSAAIAAKERVRRRLAESYLPASEEERTRQERERSVLRVVQDIQSRFHALIKVGWASSDIFSPIECHEYPGSKTGTTFVALFLRASEKLRLPLGLSVWFKITVVDEKSQLIEVASSACLSIAPPSVDEVERQNARGVFAGVFQEGVVQTAIMDLLYRLLDMAQTSAGTEIGQDRLWLELLLENR